MAYSPTLNPQVVTPTPIQSFGGMRGTDDSVITKFNSDGDNISDQYANEVIDFDCDVAGQLHVRPGCVKIGAGSLSDINAIFQVNLGGITQYAVFYGENLDLIDIPYEDFPEPFYEDPTTEEPRSDTLPSDWPTSTAGNPNQVQNDVPTEDASCTNTHTHSMTPTTLAFTMDYQGTAPAAQSIFDWVQGWWTTAQNAVYTSELYSPSTSKGWLYAPLSSMTQWLAGPCKLTNMAMFRAHVDGKDSSGNWLAVGTYTCQFQADFGDGTITACNVTLTINDQYTGNITVGASGFYGYTTATASYYDNGTTLGWKVVYADNWPLTPSLRYGFDLYKTISTGLWTCNGYSYNESTGAIVFGPSTAASPFPDITWSAINRPTGTIYTQSAFLNRLYTIT